MNGMKDLNEQIENLEPKVESAVEKKQELIEKEQALKESLNDLERDLQLMSSLQKQLDITEKDYRFIEATLADYREQVTEIQNELSEMIEITERSTGVIEDLGKLGIVADESIDILNDRKALMDQCNEQLQIVSDLLDLNYYLHMVKSVSVSSAEKQQSMEQEKSESTDSSFQKQLETQQAEFSSWNGVLIHGSISSNYSNILENRFNGGTPAARKAFEKYRSSLIIRDSSWQGGNHYLNAYDDGRERGVYIDSSTDEFDERGRGVAFYHEIGHMIDHASNNFQSFASDNNPDFYLALRADGAEIMKQYHELNDAEKEGFRRFLYKGRCNSLSDLIEPLSNGEIKGGYGHKDYYWTFPGALEHEAFAHFFEASMGHDVFIGEPKKDILQRYFPNAWREFEKMLDQIGNN